MVVFFAAKMIIENKYVAFFLIKIKIYRKELKIKITSFRSSQEEILILITKIVGKIKYDAINQHMMYIV